MKYYKKMIACAEPSRSGCAYTMMGGRDENILNKCEMFVNSLIEKFRK